MTESDETPATEEIILAAGCFWGVEADLQQIKGVTFTEVGYTGGSTTNATYKEVCGGTTGHAEAVRIKYCPDKVSLEHILDIFWKYNSGRRSETPKSQYRSAIFYFNETQRAIAEAEKTRLETKNNWTIHTEITEAGAFWRAEEYHQNYKYKRMNGIPIER